MRGRVGMGFEVDGYGFRQLVHALSWNVAVSFINEVTDLLEQTGNGFI